MITIVCSFVGKNNFVEKYDKKNGENGTIFLNFFCSFSFVSLFLAKFLSLLWLAYCFSSIWLPYWLMGIFLWI